MANARFIKQHRTWEDWAGICLGILIGLSPWLTGQALDPGVQFVAIALGLLVMLLAQLELVGSYRWLEVAELACGLGLVASPFLLGYSASGSLRYWHFALGALVALLALLELWQDWRLSDEELAKHGQ